MNIDREKVLVLAVDLLAAYADIALWEIPSNEFVKGGRVEALLRAAGLPDEAVPAWGWGASLGSFVQAVIKETREK
jgi:hypothetical protein